MGSRVITRLLRGGPGEGPGGRPSRPQVAVRSVLLRGGPGEGPGVTAMGISHRRPSDLPAGGRWISPPVAIGSPHDPVLIGRYSLARVVIDARGGRLEELGG